ncbi:putative methionine--tRNA ligase [Artemisia annua]|uniref:Putative methionine--tRNA ligase n=1 Tax=Artemisia annua TaxID=35608 RepID=A0A2U1NX06_ARTAN|nr:putative methionine--tRNA ligase [Artemisia annua]
MWVYIRVSIFVLNFCYNCDHMFYNCDHRFQYAGEFSKSKGVGVFVNDAKETNIPVDMVGDSLLTWTNLQTKINNELISNLGNFINRVLCFIARDPGYNSIVPDAPGAAAHPSSETLGKKIGTKVDEYMEVMDKVKLKQGLKAAADISHEGNGYLQGRPTFVFHSHENFSGISDLLACLLEPFMPSFSVKMKSSFTLKKFHFRHADSKSGPDRKRRAREEMEVTKNETRLFSGILHNVVRLVIASKYYHHIYGPVTTSSDHRDNECSQSFILPKVQLLSFHSVVDHAFKILDIPCDSSTKPIIKNMLN